MQEIIKKTFPLMPETATEEVERSIHNYFANRRAIRTAKSYGVNPEREYICEGKIESYLRGILSACYMAGFIDGVHHHNNSWDSQEIMEHFLQIAENFYLGN